MPIYEYECIPNKHRFEVIQKFSDPPVEYCTICGGPVQKMLSAPAIQFKGSGWYITDYAKKSSSSEDKPASTTTEKKEESKPTATETKTETKKTE